ncbi:vitamin K epoxide reductase family protein [Salinarimonas soli]|uniref:Vitamin K epoxide reductase family protein n=1 Tax=Salinarimonas soli TaxID=1638099 RepID=A0A5B2VE13_9HYPH|nr:vitamin K epoxide reductase family protein [Salinarimonas soli]KAA2236662.1 vitamin K epoxide reductase family protein [Salinarimonas soli]
MAPSPRELSRQLREETSEDLARRRWTLGLSFVGVGAGMIVGLYQTGILRRLPDLPSKYFDATRVDASTYAYKRMQTPDGLLMVASYAVTAILAGAGGRDRARENPALPIALAAKTVYDAGVALKLGKEEWDENGALCGYCQAATLASLASVALALPEAVKAVDHLLERSRDGELASVDHTLERDPGRRFAPERMIDEDGSHQPIAPRSRPHQAQPGGRPA